MIQLDVVGALDDERGRHPCDDSYTRANRAPVGSVSQAV
jgi:hypothetical protein